MSLVKAIPEKLNYYIKQEKSINLKFDDLTEIEKSFAVRPTYAVDSTNKKRCKSAKEWSKSNNGYDQTTRAYNYIDGTIIENIDNIPKSGYRIIGLETRDQGGRAWKIIDSDNHYFDLREDVLLELMLTEGVSNMGELNGKYLWCVFGSEMKLVRETSSLHRKAIELNRVKAIKPISKFKEGYIYKTKEGNEFIYLGKFDIYKEKQEEKPDWKGAYKDRFTYTEFLDKGRMLFASKWNISDIKGVLDKTANCDWGSGLNGIMDVKSTSIFVEEVEHNYQFNLQEYREQYINYYIENTLAKQLKYAKDYYPNTSYPYSTTKLKNDIFNSFTNSLVLNITTKHDILTRSNFDFEIAKYKNQFDEIVGECNKKILEYNDKINEAKVNNLNNEYKWRGCLNYVV